MNFKNANIDYYAVGMKVRELGTRMMQIVYVTPTGDAFIVDTSTDNDGLWYRSYQRCDLILDLGSVWIGRRYRRNESSPIEYTVEGISRDGNFFLMKNSNGGHFSITLLVLGYNYAPVPIEPSNVEPPVKVGDVIRTDGFVGVVSKVNHNSFVIQDRPGKEWGCQENILFTDNFTKYVPEMKP